jgi:hypothetical protein
LAAIMTFDYAPVNLQSVSSRYREEVRKTVPDSLQSQIRAACGDRVMPGGALILPARCSISLPAAEVAAAAAALRARPNPVGELYWHRAAVANQLAQADIVRQIAANLTASIAS